MRGKWGDLPSESKILKINVTSSQQKTNKNRLAFSPMTEIEGKYKGYYCFENYWQGGKVYEGIDPKISKEWWLKQTTGKRRYPMGKSKKVLYGIYDGKKYNYIDARKNVYVPEYHSLIHSSKKSNSALKDLIDKYNNGVDIAIYDFDGPRSNDSSPICELLTIDLLREKINNPIYPFGHGYVVAASIAGYDINEYTQY